MKAKLILSSILFFAFGVTAHAQNTFPATGNVGIGTSTPQDKLDVRVNIRLNDNTIFLRGSGDNNHGFAYKSTFAGQAIDGPTMFGWSGGALGSLSGGEKLVLRWTQSGNVGIGTNAPTERLSVNGNVIVGDINYHYLVLSPDGLSVRWGGVYAGRPRLFNIDCDLNAPRTIIGGGAGIITGDYNADYKLAVNGKIVAKSVYVTMTGWGDFVFDKNYHRMSWLDKKIFFEVNKHLPGVVKAAEIEQNGVNLSETLKYVTINVEENSLDIIDLYQRLEKLEKDNIQLKKELATIKAGF